LSSDLSPDLSPGLSPDLSPDSFNETLASEIMLILQGLMMDRRLLTSLANGMDDKVDRMFDTETERKYCKSHFEQRGLQRDLKKAILFSRTVVEKSKFDNLDAKFISYLKGVLSKVDDLNVLQIKRKSDSKISRLRKKYPIYEVYATANLIYALLERFVAHAEKLYHRCHELNISGHLCAMVLSKAYVKQCYIEQWCSPISSFDIKDSHFRCFVLTPPCDTCSRHFKRCDSKIPICSFCETLQKKSCVISHRMLCTDPNSSQGGFPLMATDEGAKLTTNGIQMALSSDEATEEEFLDVYKVLLIELPLESHQVHNRHRSYYQRIGCPNSTRSHRDMNGSGSGNIVRGQLEW